MSFCIKPSVCEKCGKPLTLFEGRYCLECEKAEQEPKYCDRNICLKNEYNGIGCDECEVTKSQEPCDDAINRQAVLDYIHRILNQGTGKKKSFEFIQKYVEKLPPVKLQEKTGYWIMKHRTHNEVKHYTGQDEMGETHTISVLERYEVDEPYCSECGKRAGDTSQDYCCACGAKMVKPQESEVQDANRN